MAVRETQLSPEQKSQERAIQETGEKELASRLAASMDLPSTLAGEVDDHIKKGQKPEPEEEEVEEENPEVPADEIEEETKGSEEESEESSEDFEEEDEDLIPKSKVQKRIDELTSKLRRLEAELEKSKVEKPQTPKDSDEALLERMSESELKALAKQVRVEQIKNHANEAKLAELVELEDKIHNTLRTAPDRFNSAQVQNFNRAVQETAETLEGFDKVKNEIFNYAKSIYESSPEFHSSVHGQERAWKFAVDHFKAINKVSEGKSIKSELERQVNTLKKKISVDTTSKKTVNKPTTDTQLFKKAVYGTDADKATFLKTRISDSILSDDSLGGFNRR